MGKPPRLLPSTKPHAGLLSLVMLCCLSLVCLSSFWYCFCFALLCHCCCCLGLDWSGIVVYFVSLFIPGWILGLVLTFWISCCFCFLVVVAGFRLVLVLVLIVWFFLVAGLVVCVVALIAWFWMSLCSCTLLRISSFWFCFGVVLRRGEGRIWLFVFCSGSVSWSLVLL